nr:M23 family metallopeptidase [Bacteroidales bacterium]
MKKILLLFLFNVISSTIFSQAKVDFRPPLDIPLILSGNFGELRSDHFHSGIDIKTQGITGHKVFAVDSGYVSRIKVQAGGYGKALYINHPSGYTTVYGHLSDYNLKIGNFVRDQQYNKESHSVDIYLKPGDIIIQKGELIALTGNTGSSAGPHLHFEIRKANKQIPVNALFFNLPIKDDIHPVFKKIAFYPRDEKAEINNSNEVLQLDLTVRKDTFRISNKKELKVFGSIGIGVEIYDYLNGSRNRCGIFSLELILDGIRYFYSEMDA